MQKNVMYALKIIIAASIACVLADRIGLSFAISTGIVTILTIQPTKKETIKTALGRIYAFGIALGIAFVCFSIFDYTLTAFLVYLIPYILLCRLFNWNSAMAMNSVLISHFITLGSMDSEAVINELLIFVIGVGIGILANLHLHKKTACVEKLEQETDAQIVKILMRMSERIMDKDITDYNGNCFKILKQNIRVAEQVAEENFNNQFGTKDIFDKEYIAMRDKQCQVLYEMYKDVRLLNSSPITAQKIADFFVAIAKSYDKENDATQLLRQFKEMDAYMKEQPLPISREEFEDRARLFVLMRSIEEFLQIKMEFTIKNQKL